MAQRGDRSTRGELITGLGRLAPSQPPGTIAVIVPSAVGALSPAGKLGFTNIAKARPKKVQA